MIRSSHHQPYTSIARLLSNISQPNRLKILLGIGAGEANVTHLEKSLGLRQAYLSQHLMALRRVGLVKTRRAGRNVFYRLASPDLLEVLFLVGSLAGSERADLVAMCPVDPLPDCSCPHCETGRALQTRWVVFEEELT